ncbi:MAG: ABC transporter substrate-binding protein [Spirochaetaceae bacterium]|nr:ABC transporter substrate-binding protein [Spirochaetaceae bacterium]
MRKIYLVLLLSVQSLWGLDNFRLGIGFIPHVQFTPLYVGITMGFFAEEGINLELDYIMGADLTSLLLSGQLTAILTDGDHALIAASSGLPVRAFAQYYRSSPLSIASINAHVQSPGDLRGRVIGTPELYGSSYIALREFLRYHNLEGAVTIERIGFTQLAMLQSGHIDAAVTFANHENVILAELPGFIHFDLRNFSNLVGAAFVTGSNQINNNADLFIRFNRALAKSLQFTRQNRQLAYSIFEAFVPAAHNELTFRILEATLPYFSLDGTLNSSYYSYTLQILAGLNMLNGTVNLANFLWQP